MFKMPPALSALAFGTSIFASGAYAADDHGKMDQGQMGHDQMDHSKMDHGAMSHEAQPGATQASGVGVVNSVDSAKKQVNLTHEPMPQLGWPQMTMDLPVTSGVDLGSVKPGDKVSFTLKLGRDKVYRIMEMSPDK